MLNKTTYTNWKKTVNSLGKKFSTRARKYDQNDEFVERNYRDLKEVGFFSAMIPKELGGEGVKHSEMCELLRLIAQCCSATALAASMHQHLIATNIWKWRNGKSDGVLLEKVAENDLILISTGAADWLNSSGSLKKTKGGYEMTARKVFCSQAPAGDILVTSAVYDHPDKGPTVFHFPLKKGRDVQLMDDWKAMGMRGTGSYSIQIQEAFIPEKDIVLERPKGKYHPAWNVVLTAAMPLITAVYVGIAEAAASKAFVRLKKKEFQEHHAYLAGEMKNQLAIADMALSDAVAVANNFDFDPQIENAEKVLSRKTIAVKAAVKTVEKAMEAVGGAGFFRKNDLERLFRDVQAGKYHPLPEKEQHKFTGRLALELQPFNNNGNI